jgi:hypothetical protein
MKPLSQPHSGFTCAIMLAGVLLPGGQFAAEPEGVRDVSFFLRRLRSVDHLPVLEDSHTALASTWDRTGGNDDGTDFKRLAGNRNVLLDADGPGCIHRLFTGTLGKSVAGTRIQVFIDNQPTPVFDEEVNRFFDDKAGPFPYPLVFHKTYPGLLLPIPYAQHCLVQLVNDQPKKPDPKNELAKWGNYWQVTYTTHPKATQFQSLHWPLNEAESKELAAVCKAWLQAESTPPAPPAPWTVDQTFALAPGGTRKVQVDGCGVLRELRISVAPTTPEVLRGLRLRMTWDGASSASVDVPLGYFFGNADYGTEAGARFSSLVLGVTASEAYARFPMPYEKGAVLELVNESGLSASAVTVRLDAERRPALPANWGRFHATWREERVSGEEFQQLRSYGKQKVPVHLVLESTNGPGKYVGVLLHVHWPVARSWWGEGDWLIWSDEDGWPPSYHGTGSEEYFNSGWCQFDRKAMSGYVVADYVNRPGNNAVYSLHLNDAFQFRTSVRVAVEIMPWVGAGIPLPGALWGSTAYWYASPAQPAASRPDLVSRQELDQQSPEAVRRWGPRARNPN